MSLTEKELQIWASALVELEEWDGHYYCSMRGLARLLGISPSTFTDGRVTKGRPRGLFWRIMLCTPDELPNSLKGIAGFNYQLSEEINGKPRMLPEEVIEAVVRYYAEDCLVPKERAAVLLKVLDTLIT